MNEKETVERLSGAIMHLNMGASHEAYCYRMLEALDTLFGAEIDSCSFMRVDAEALHATIVSSDATVNTAACLERWSELATTGPMVEMWSSMQVGQVSSLLEIGPSPSRVRELPIHEKFLSRFNMNHHLIFSFFRRGGVTLSVGCYRARSEFCTHHRDVLNTFGVHLSHAYGRIEANLDVSRPDLVTKRELSWVWSGSVVVNPRGNILSMTSCAAEILPAYFGRFPRHTSLIPAPVQSWFDERIVHGRLRDEAPSLRSWSCRGGLELSLYLSRLEANGQFLLRLRHRQPIRSETIMNCLGTTMREAQVIRDLIRCASQREVGESLGMSAHTVRTHRQRIYEKLDVNDRIGLVLKVQQLLMENPQPEPLCLPAKVSGS